MQHVLKLKLQCWDLILWIILSNSQFVFLLVFLIVGLSRREKIVLLLLELEVLGRWEKWEK